MLWNEVLFWYASNSFSFVLFNFFIKLFIPIISKTLQFGIIDPMKIRIGHQLTPRSLLGL